MSAQLTKQAVANSYADVATAAKTLIDSVTITTFYALEIRPFGSDKWLIVLVYA